MEGNCKNDACNDDEIDRNRRKRLRLAKNKIIKDPRT